MTQQEFWKWYDEQFFKKWSGIMPHEEWPNDVDKYHEELRSFIGGTSRLRKFSMKDCQFPIDVETRQKFHAEIGKLLPDYFKHYGFNYNLFKNPTIEDKRFKGQRISRHIQFYANKKITDKTNKEKLARLMSDMGQAWAKAKTKDHTFEIIMETSPMAFSLLGHYKSDVVRGSCFRQGGCHQLDKYKLGQHPNTFVMLVGNNLSDISENNNGIFSRMWGIANDNFDSFYLSNIYVQDIDQIGNVYKGLEMFFDDLLPGDKIKKAEKIVKVRGAYNNAESIGFTKLESGIKFQEFELTPHNGLEQAILCPKCHKGFRKGEKIDSQYWCWACADSIMAKCEISGKRTYRLYTVYDEGRKLNVCKEILDELFRYCSYSGKYYKKEYIVNTFDYGCIHKDLLKQLKIKECLKCNSYSIPDSSGKCRVCLHEINKVKSNDTTIYSHSTYATTA